MREYAETQKTVVKQNVLVKIVCDICGDEAPHVAEHPGAPWLWKPFNKELPDSIAGDTLSCHYCIGNDYGDECADLCHSCADRLITAIKNRTLKLSEVRS